MLFSEGFFGGNLGRPLEGGERFGDKSGNAGVDHGSVSDFTPLLEGAEAQIGDGGNVVIGFGGEPDHEVGFDVAPAAAVGFAGKVDQVFVGNEFVDDGAQAGCGGFRGEGEAASADSGEVIGQFDSEGIEAE